MDTGIKTITRNTNAQAVGQRVMVAMSGGVDSSVAAALCVEALGKERVIAVLMPRGEQPDIDKAYELVNHLGCSLAVAFP